VRIYITAWFQAPVSTSAPRLDLQLLKDIDNYRSENGPVAAIALKKYLGHLWYLSEELVAFAFFDDSIENETKRSMLRAMDAHGDEHPLKRVTIDASMIQSKKLEDFLCLPILGVSLI